MSEQSNVPIMSGAPEPFYQTWIKALTQPNERTYAEMAMSPNAKAATAYLWYFIAMLVQFFFASLVQNAYLQQIVEQFGNGEYSQYISQGQGIVSRLITAICGAPIAAGVGVLFFALSVALVQWIAKMFGGRGTNDQMAYTMSAILTPYLLISSILTLLSAIPFVGLCFSLLSLLAGLYILVLEVMAVKGVNQFGWGQAIGSLFIPILGITCLCACVVGGTVALLGSVMGETFRQIQQGLGQ
jgi:hypothetical protein